MVGKVEKIRKSSYMMYLSLQVQGSISDWPLECSSDKKDDEF